MALILTSGAFTAGGPIPSKYTCDGADVSPALAWSGAPPGTVAFALIADDPDAPAGTWVHWVLFNLPGSLTALPEGVPKTEQLRRPGRRAPGPERLSTHRLWRPVPAAGQGAPLLLQALRARRGAAAQGRRHQAGRGARDARPRAGRDVADGHVRAARPLAAAPRVAGGRGATDLPRSRRSRTPPPSRLRARSWSSAGCSCCAGRRSRGSICPAWRGAC